jgi:hypothetical protein
MTERIRLGGYADPYRGDSIERLGADGMPNGTYSKVKYLLASDANHVVYEVADEFNREMYVVRTGETSWVQIELKF